jgi:beta-lactamase regulating signal transducer with metallopeptidase domain
MLWWFAETTCVAGLLACVAALAGRTRAIGPSARHVLWLVVLIKLITPPLIKAPWPVAIWPAAEDRALKAVVPRSHPTLKREEPSHGGHPSGAETDNGLPVAAEQVGTGRPAVVPVSQAMAIPVEEKPSESQGWISWRPDPSVIGQWTLTGWLLGTVALGLVQVSRIIRFQAHLRAAVPAPDWLTDEAQRIGGRLGVRVPEILAVPCLGTPMLWCLGRPKLLLPCRFIKSFEASRWRGILAHELAHLSRGDHWVGRIELAAGLIWWWNPLYWLTRRQLDTEAELACDAWVVWALPDDRLNYAEVLFQICSEFSQACSPAPALGITGSGRFFERRLTMILRDRVSCGVSPLILLSAGLLALLALPSWTHATPSALIAPDQEASVAPAQAPSGPSTSQVADDEDDEDDDAMDADEDEDDDDDQKTAERPKGKAAGSAKKKPSKPKAEKKDLDIDLDLSGIEKQIESALGPDFEKKIEAWAEKFGKEMEEKFGDNSEFAKKMEALGEEMEKKFGDNSEFAKKMEALGKEMEKKFGPGSEFEKKIKEKAESAHAKTLTSKPSPSRAEAKQSLKAEKRATKPRARTQQRAARIKELEAKINALVKELKALESSDQDDNDDEDNGSDNDKKGDE